MTSPEFNIGYLKLPVLGADPTTISGSGKLYSKTTGSVAQAIFESDDGTVSQLTPPTFGAGTVAYSKLTNLITIGSVKFANSTGSQSLFPNASVTLSGSTTYKMKGQFRLNYFGTPANHVISMSFGGTATYTYFNYVAQTVSTNSSASQGTNVATEISSSASAKFNGGGTTTVRMCFFEGLIATAASGTFTPQINFSPAPTVTPTSSLSSYIELVPLGSSSFVQQGGWS